MTDQRKVRSSRYPFGMLSSSMAERIWYILVYFLGCHIQAIRPMRDSTGLQAQVVGSNNNGTTVHISLQQHDQCLPGSYKVKVYPTDIEEGMIRERRSNQYYECQKCQKCSAYVAISCSELKQIYSANNHLVWPSDLAQFGPSLRCRRCADESSAGFTGKMMACIYDVEFIERATTATNSAVAVPNRSDNSKSKTLSDVQEVTNVQEAGKDERNSWYFLSLCALIGLLVFLSLVMGAYLVSVKVTSWWRYQRPITVTSRRGHRDNHAQLEHTTVTLNNLYPEVSESMHIQTNPRAIEGAPEEQIRLSRHEDVEDISKPSTSGLNTKLHFANAKLKYDSNSDLGSVASVDSIAVDVRKFYNYQSLNPFIGSYSDYDDDLSDFCSSDDGDFGASLSPSHGTPVLQRSAAKIVTQCTPALDVNEDRVDKSDDKNDTDESTSLTLWKDPDRSCPTEQNKCDSDEDAAVNIPLLEQNEDHQRRGPDRETADEVRHYELSNHRPSCQKLTNHLSVPDSNRNVLEEQV